ncbi:oligosaccharide flippase family protein [Devosia oryziradicis]|uniref:Oligosaccharide flippase family protein n=1 Tax=Devosia oryziradicis TaxID=2801335 RepID=A0ABX7BV66_9HYPH|nr:oligosaccharide flippase family protein [Devosia oryziradicis]QQR35432.1 oligosaccharide flippase family protein [Devosia oryziradicis]
MTRHKLLLAISLLSKIGTGMVSLFVLARGLGPADYGFVATVFAYASIAALFTDFGFSVQALRDIGAQPDKAGELIAACVRVKNLLVLVVTLGAALVLSLLNLGPHLLAASLLLYGSIMVNSYGDLVVVALRGIGKYAAETVSSILGTVVFVIVVGGTALAWPDILPIATALFVARLLQTAIAFLVVSRYTQLGNCIHGPLLDLLRFMRTSSGLALDSFLTTITGQIDVILVGALLGLHAAGTYQIAARVASYAVLPAQVLAGVNIPALSRDMSDHGRVKTPLIARFFLEYLAIGTVVAVGYAVFMATFSQLVFGTGYEISVGLWSGFCLLVLVRYLSASTGVLLIIYKQVRWRLIVQFLAACAIAGLVTLFSLAWGVAGAAWALATSILLAGILYAWGVFRIQRESNRYSL